MKTTTFLCLLSSTVALTACTGGAGPIGTASSSGEAAKRGDPTLPAEIDSPAEDETSRSDADTDKPMADTTADERGQICEQMAAERGGYRDLHCELSNGTTRSLQPIGTNQEQCVDYIGQNLRSCDGELTVRSFLACHSALVRDVCVEGEPIPDECGDVVAHCIEK